MDDQLLKPKEAAAQLRVSVATLKGWRRQPSRGPRFIAIGPKSIRYTRQALDEFIRSHEAQQ